MPKKASCCSISQSAWPALLFYFFMIKSMIFTTYQRRPHGLAGRSHRKIAALCLQLPSVSRLTSHARLPVWLVANNPKEFMYHHLEFQQYQCEKNHAKYFLQQVRRELVSVDDGGKCILTFTADHVRRRQDTKHY